MIVIYSQCSQTIHKVQTLVGIIYIFHVYSSSRQLLLLLYSFEMLSHSPSVPSHFVSFFYSSQFETSYNPTKSQRVKDFPTTQTLEQPFQFQNQHVPSARPKNLRVEEFYVQGSFGFAISTKKKLYLDLFSVFVFITQFFEF